METFETAVASPWPMQACAIQHATGQKVHILCQESVSRSLRAGCHTRKSQQKGEETHTEANVSKLW